MICQLLVGGIMLMKSECTPIKIEPIKEVKKTEDIKSANENGAFFELIRRESNWEAGRINKNSFACGLGQALPCTKIYPDMTKEKMREVLVEREGKWYLPEPDYDLELQWAKDYILDRYGTDEEALRFHNEHGWY